MSQPAPSAAQHIADVRAFRTTPAAALEATQERIDRLNSPSNAVVATFAEESAAMAASAKGELAGLPLLVKDTFTLPWRAPREGAGRPTGVLSAGPSALYDTLRDSGGVLVGISNTHQLGIGSTGHISAYGPCLNPWDASRCAGGSSGGSAAAVAAGMVSAAIGTDGAGSIRIPASYCGIVGLKPTWGAVSERGCTSSYSSMAVTGPMARNAEDCRIVAETLLGHSLSPTNRALRIGIVEGELWNDVEPDVARECRDALGRLEATGATVQQVELEHLQQVVICSVLKMSSERLPLIGPDWLEQMGDDLHPFVRGLLLARQLTTAPTIARIDRMRGALRRTLQTAFRSVDVLVWPTAPSIAPLVDHPVVDLPSGRTSVDLANVRHTGLANLTGVPAITVPCRTNGMPVGLMAHAAWGREDLLFSFAERTEV